MHFPAIDPAQGSAFWGVYAKPADTTGTGKRMEFEALELVFGELGVHKLNCQVWS
jgi:hypothetical protein